MVGGSYERLFKSSWIATAGCISFLVGLFLVAPKQKEEPQTGRKKRTEGIRALHTKIAGLTHENPDGTSRQFIIEQCRPYERVSLEHDPENEHDENAVKVMHGDGSQIGFIPAHLAEEFAAKRKRGFTFDAYIDEIFEGDDELLFAGLTVFVISPECRGTDAQEFIKRTIREMKEHDKEGNA